MSANTVYLLQAFALGAVITFTYDWLWILRKVVCHRQFVINLEDIGFWLLWGLLVFIWMYRVSNGGMRWFAVGGAVFGMCLYRGLISDFFVKGMSFLLEKILHILSKVLRQFWRPIGHGMRKAGSCCKRTGRKSRKLLGRFIFWLKIKRKAFKMRIEKR